MMPFKYRIKPILTRDKIYTPNFLKFIMLLYNKHAKCIRGSSKPYDLFGTLIFFIFIFLSFTIFLFIFISSVPVLKLQQHSVSVLGSCLQTHLLPFSCFLSVLMRIDPFILHLQGSLSEDPQLGLAS